MTFDNILELLGGLALFLYGMHMMSEGLSAAAGEKMRNILEKLTSKWYLGILVGAGITAVIQSSSATTVMVVGFVNSGLMTLRQAIWIIMGANIGTTVTGLLVALNMGDLAPFMAIVGVVLVTFISNKKANDIGTIVAGLGVLFIGLGMMSDAMYPLRHEPIFINFMSTVSNPFIAIAFGAGFTALIQSSSASVGILQSLANSGLIPLSSSIYIIFGQNIGTCITSLLASISANRGAKRTTVIHLSFNLIGTLIFLILVNILPLVSIIEGLTDSPMAQIAYTHTMFNIFTTILLIPFGEKLAVLAEKVLPILPEEIETDEAQLPLSFVDTTNIGNVPLAIFSLRKEAIEMLMLSQANINESIEALLSKMPDASDDIKKREERINFINYEITNYMSQVSTLVMSEHESDVINSLYKCFTDIERVGDHAINIIKHTKIGQEKIKNVEVIKEEMDALKQLINASFDIILSENFNDELQIKHEDIEQRIDDLTELFKTKQIERCAEGKVDAIDTVYYTQVMTDIERVSDHLINITQEFNKYHYKLSD